MMNSSKCIKAIATQSDPYTIITGNGSNVKVTGIMMNFLDEVRKYLGVCFNVEGKTGQGYGNRLPNGTYTGILGPLLKNEVQLSISPIKLTLERTKDFMVSKSISMTSISVMYKYPSIGPDLSGFVKPFNYYVWVYLLLTTLIVSFALFARKIINKKIRNLEISNSEKKFDGTMLMTFQVIFSQGAPRNKEQNSVICTWILASMILGMIYKSNLNAMLVFPKVYSPFDNMVEMTEQDKVGWIISTGTAFVLALKKADPGSLYNKLYQKAQYVFTKEEAYLLVDSGKYGFLADNTALLSMIDQSFRQYGHCRQTKMKEEIYYSSQGLIFNKDFGLVKEFNTLITRFTEFGIFDFWLSEATKNTAKCTQNPASETLTKLRPLSLRDFYGVFALYFCGLGIACVIFALEILTKVVKEKLTRKM